MIGIPIVPVGNDLQCRTYKDFALYGSLKKNHVIILFLERIKKYD